DRRVLLRPGGAVPGPGVTEQAPVARAAAPAVTTLLSLMLASFDRRRPAAPRRRPLIRGVLPPRMTGQRKQWVNNRHTPCRRRRAPQKARIVRKPPPPRRPASPRHLGHPRWESAGPGRGWVSFWCRRLPGG